MKNHRPRTRLAKKIPPPRALEDGNDAVIAYHNKYSLDELERAGYLEEVPPEEIRDLEESVEREIQRRKVKGLAGEYPKAHRQLKPTLVALLDHFQNLKPGIRKETANRINVIADKARDLDEITQRLMNERHTPEEIAELLYAFQEMASYIRSYSDKLAFPVVEIFDHVKGFPSQSNSEARNHSTVQPNRKVSKPKKQFLNLRPV